MRTRFGWAFAVLGALVALLGLAMMVYLGPDSRVATGPHAVQTDGIAVVTAPKVISWADVQVDVLAEVPVRKPIFVGLGNSVDVQNYVAKTSRLEVTGFHTPWKVEQHQVDGQVNLPGAPTAVDWWLAESAGLGGASISTTLPDQTVSIAILSVGSSNLTGLEVSLAYGVKGGFAKGTGLLLLGLGGVWSGLLMRRGDSAWSDAEDEEVVYVYVDEDGVEHEISAEEAQDYEVVEEVVEELEVEPDQPQPQPEPEPVVPEPVVVRAEPDPSPAVAPAQGPPKVPGVMTAAEIAGAAPAPAPAPEPEERVMYVFVDEDGVEHEVSEDELDEFEIVDEEDQT